MFKLVGLTGGIGTGKSTVARMIRDLGVPVIDADLLARQVVEPGQPAHAEIVAAWPDVIDQGGAIDRKKLAERIFAAPASRAHLEAITHPRITERALQQADELRRQGLPLAFLEAALLVEAGLHRRLDGLVLVVASEEQQVSRVMARDGCSRSQALARLQAQLPLEEKLRAATEVIDNSGDEAATQRQVAALVRRLLAAG
ncbi:MAG TPA: dephospho-CoA kinase [Polyangia bacterium]|jgi:dephospho-CoA kinase|nr:dephospho-CoA kinase [Polyangia bacterium]